ncbi:hypothetical protein O23A_p1502 [Aeromonas salmonicida]|nr:hypothetical protein O23A_p1502 [Aeromonas salmonicida]
MMNRFIAPSTSHTYALLFGLQNGRSTMLRPYQHSPKREKGWFEPAENG